MKAKILRMLIVFSLCRLGYGNVDLIEKYKTGSIRFIPDIVLKDDNLPDGHYFGRITGIAEDRNGSIYLLDGKEANIKKFDSSGKFLKAFGRRGQGPGEFGSPSLIAGAGDRILVWESASLRFSLFGSNGAVVKILAFPMSKGRPRRIQGLPNGAFIIETETIYWDSAKPQDVCLQLYSQDMEFVRTIYQHPVLRNIWSRQSGNIPLPFSGLVYWDVTPAGTIVVGFGEKYELSIYSQEGVKINSFSHSTDSVPITKEDIERAIGGITSTTSRADGSVISGGKIPAEIRGQIKIPEFKPFFFNVRTDFEGNTIVFPHRKDWMQDGDYFDAFSPKGEYIGTVELEIISEKSRMNSPRFMDGKWWSISIDREMNVQVIRYRVENQEPVIQK